MVWHRNIRGEEKREMSPPKKRDNSCRGKVMGIKLIEGGVCKEDSEDQKG